MTYNDNFFSNDADIQLILEYKTVLENIIQFPNNPKGSFLGHSIFLIFLPLLMPGNSLNQVLLIPADFLLNLQLMLIHQQDGIHHEHQAAVLIQSE